MNFIRNISVLAILCGLVIGLPGKAQAQAAAGNALKSALKSKAAMKFADLLAGYLLGKTLDSIYASATQPDPKQLDKALGDFQKDHPEYTVMLGTLRRAVKTDGTPTTRREFEGLAQDLIFQMDHSLLNSSKTPAPSLQWNPSSITSLGIEQGLGLNRLNLSGLNVGSSEGLRNPLKEALITGRTTFPLLSAVKEDGALAAKIVGAWSFSHRSNPGSGADVYIFHRNGRITEYKVFDRNEIFTFNGTYSVEGKKLTIRWELPNGLGDLLTASIEEIDAGHLKYTPDKGLFELTEPVAKTLTRISDVGHFSVVTLSNPTNSPVIFEIRWATVDGFWTDWKPMKFEPGSMWSVPQPGGFLCQIIFDASFAEGRQEKIYELPFNVVSDPHAPTLLDEGGYRISVENDIVDLVPEKLSLAKPTPGVR